MLEHLARPIHLWHTEIMTSISVPQKRVGRPATGKTPRIGVRIPDDIRDALEAYAAETSSGEPNISEAIRALLADALRDKGYLQMSDEDASDKA